MEALKIKAKYEEAVGHKIGSGQIYEVLTRRRKVMLQSLHPKKAAEAFIEISKELTFA